MKTFNSALVAIMASSTLSALTACSHTEKFFPDKERDYQHVHEIPMLNWPTELRAHTTPVPFSRSNSQDITTLESQHKPVIDAVIEKERTPKVEQSVNRFPTDTTDTSKAMPESQSALPPEISEKASATPKTQADATALSARSKTEVDAATAAPISVNASSSSEQITNGTPLVDEGVPVPVDVAEEPIPTREAPILANAPNDNDPKPDQIESISKPVVIERLKKANINRLRLTASLTRTWRLVGKALSRQSMDVIERSQDKGLYIVQYDPNEKKPHDGTLLDEVNFIFKGFQINEQEYRLKLQENSDYTDIVIVDKKQIPLIDTPASVKLLDTLEKTIKLGLKEDTDTK